MTSRLATSVADIAQRVTVSALFGLTIYGMVGMYGQHRATMRAADEAWKKHQADEAAQQKLQDDPLLEGFVDPPSERPS
ncbi:hypothetical protein Rt10032_c07g3275 [Rhodotorula toruloides]|uniref:Uncharacterized protein n=1 Tax=Rhodotorula toruloides TaxID=5286 RepID=A0A511KFV8_RHOTO|nr:hypothetical protein Rt10032_c07g3275 [Rhodotorula toruloides]